MRMTGNTTAIDNDFLNHLLEIRTYPNLEDLIFRFFSALQIRAVMHPFVRHNEAEIKQNVVRDNLFSAGIISEVNLDELLFCDEEKVKYYSMIVRVIYKDFTGKDYPCKDVLHDWVSQSNLGEVHTVVMCALLYYDCFLSDDGDAARDLQGIVSRRLAWRVNIYNRKRSCDYLLSLPQESRSALNRSEIRLLAHKC